MGYYRKKPVVIEAFRYAIGEPTAWYAKAVADGLITEATERGCTIKTLEGEMRALAGDYIIQGVKGEIYPCKPDIFEATYEAVTAPA